MYLPFPNDIVHIIYTQPHASKETLLPPPPYPQADYLLCASAVIFTLMHNDAEANKVVGTFTIFFGLNVRAYVVQN